MKLIRKLFLKIKKRYFPTEHQKMVKKYFSDGGDTNFRFDYKLNANSVVFDVGGYEGQWASDIFSRYQSTIFIFEPVKKFYLSIKDRFRENSKIKVFNFGIGGTNREEYIKYAADGSSIFSKGVSGGEKIKINDYLDFITSQSVKHIDLIKMNIEGGEFELLEKIIQSGNISMIDNLQIQFHDVFPGARERMLKIQAELSKTHILTYQYLFVWENWEKINLK